MVGLRSSIKAIGFLSTILLARLLSVQDFGIVAIAMSLYALIDMFGAFGVDTVLIQKQNATEDQFNTAWTINFCFGILACILLICIAWPAGKFYNNHNLVSVFFSVAFLFIFNGVKNIGVVEFRKNLTFDKEFKFLIIPKLIGTTVTICLAFWMRNFWALIIGSLTWKGSEAMLSYWVHPFRPKFSLVAFRELFSFSKYLLLNNMIQFFNTRFLELILGRILSIASVGLYSISWEISSIPAIELIAPINRAVYPGYARVASDKQRLKTLYLNTIGLIVLLITPVSIGLICVARPAVLLFLGERWNDAIPLIEILSLACLFIQMNSNIGYIFYAVNKPRVLTLFSVGKLAVIIPGSATMAILFDLYAVCLFICGVSAVLSILYQYMIIRELDMKQDLFQYVTGSFVRPVIGVIIMFLLLRWYWLPWLYSLGLPMSVVLLCAVIAGVLIYWLVVLGIWYFCKRPAGAEQMLIAWTRTHIQKLRWVTMRNL